ncbi:hypothetical protein [Dyadobacter sp. 676]|uniref:Uncharacterized protein n=1 Tax=Dyadobacter sp. 676 TaxID=3088362 RepID=A0AAU8FG22_9BACT
MTRALQAVGSGSGSADEFIAMVSEELDRYAIDYRIAIDNDDVINLAGQYRELIRKWETLPEGDGIELDFPIENWA